ncbi:alpha-galactosidase [Bacillus sp. OV322]|nr:alpha-galactosidase [Bacillus sp. OV322]SFC18809.1 alpha-galactosidase [Bacillus sp. OV322]
MLIMINDEKKQFHLCNGKVSYIFHVMENGQLGSLYYGKALHHQQDFSHMQTYGVPATYTAQYHGKRAFSLETLRQEYPAYGTSDFREPAYSIRLQNGSHITDFTYKTYVRSSGKPPLAGLPSTYTVNEGDAESIQIILEDRELQAELILCYTIFKDFPVIARSAYIFNKGSDPFYLERFMSMSVDFPDADFRMLQLSGAWARERYVKERPLEAGIQSISSIRGASSHQHNPLLVLKRPDAGESKGEVYGFNFVYSSNFIAQAEVDQFGVTRATMGIHPFRFSWKLSENEHFQAPEAVMVYSSDGLTGMSQAYHDLYRKHLLRGKWKNDVRPIVINNWEATYFSFNEDILLKFARKAKELGVELFVLDDGWFGKRNNASSSLGDWYADPKKLPHGMKSLAEKIERIGLKFGLWFEPEMVSPDSRMMRAHPEWAVKTPGRPASLGRNQLVLDFSRKDIVKDVYSRMADIIRETNLSYIKWDMNRYITEAFSRGLGADRQDEFFHRYILGVYELYERLTSEFPQILFESCAGGGGRFDPGLFYYAPQAWASDDTDPVERLKIQYGSSYAYPIYSIGSHVSAAPNHQTQRSSPLSMRANVAYFGTFGYELDPGALSDAEEKEVKEQIRFFKQHRHLIMTGDFFRLNSPFEGNEAAWMVVSKDKKEALCGWYKILAEPNPNIQQKLKLAGLAPAAKYMLVQTEEIYNGDELMYHGLTLPLEFNGPNKKRAKRAGDFQSAVFYLANK